MQTPNAPDRFAFWLVPAASEHKFFSELIANLGDRFDAPVFEPHLTLHGNVSERGRAERVLREIPMDASYALEIDGIYFSTKFTQTLFVRFRLSAELRKLRSALATALGLEDEAAFDPHLSLLYKEMAESEKAALAQEVKIPFREVIFDSMKLITHPPRIVSRADVETWQVIDQRPLLPH